MDKREKEDNETHANGFFLQKRVRGETYTSGFKHTGKKSYMTFDTRLQLALDFTDLERALYVARAVASEVDIIEAGTPLIKSEGLNVIRALRKEFPKHTIVADMKTMDVGALETEIALKAGANIVTILSAADVSTIEEGVNTARKYNGKIMVDLMNLKDLGMLATYEKIGVDYVCVHVGIDQQHRGMKALDFLRSVAGKTKIPIAVAGGINETSAPLIAQAGASILIVGSAITKAADPKRAARAIAEAMRRKPIITRAKEEHENPEKLLSHVSSANIADALHGEGALVSVRRVAGGNTKMFGRIVTVRVAPGDWAKTVEAIDVAQPGDVIVVDAANGRKAVWGGIATYSAKRKGIKGVVVYGAVRDLHEIIPLSFPVYATRTVAAAGEPKGFGEIGLEITIDGVRIRTGDYAFGDETGVVIIPHEKLQEIIHRSRDIAQREEALRQEIAARKKTFSEVANIRNWEMITR